MQEFRPVARVSDRGRVFFEIRPHPSRAVLKEWTYNGYVKMGENSFSIERPSWFERKILGLSYKDKIIREGKRLSKLCNELDDARDRLKDKKDFCAAIAKRVNEEID